MGSGCWLLLAVSVAAVVLVLPSVQAWPGMPRYQCFCPDNHLCATYTCRSFEFICTCDECSCFAPELPQQVNDLEKKLEKDMTVLDMLLSGQYQALLGKKR